MSSLTRCATPETSEKLYHIVDRFEKEVERMGADMRGGNPSPGNIAGGLTTIEEKSLGCISKCGTAPIKGVIEYAENIPKQGLYFMDSREMISNACPAWPPEARI